MEAGYRVHPDVAWRLVDGVVFILTPDSRFHKSEDEVGRTIWQAIAAAPPGQPATVVSLLRQLTETFDIDEESAARDLRQYLAELRRVGALECIEP